MSQNIDVKTLDKIIKKTISSILDGRGQIYEVYEMARDELDNVRRDVERVKNETVELIRKVDELERKERKARIHLMEVSRDFKVTLRMRCEALMRMPEKSRLILL